MSNNTVIWSVVIICKILIFLALLFCCTKNRNRRRNVYQQPVVNSNVTRYPEIHVPIPYQHVQPNAMCNNFPQPHQNLQQPPQFCNVRDDLPPTYSEAVNQNYYTK